MPPRKKLKIGDCPNCMTAKHIITDFQQGDMVCRNCGLVRLFQPFMYYFFQIQKVFSVKMYENIFLWTQVLEGGIIDDSPEWRSFASESAGMGAGEDKSRACTLTTNTTKIKAFSTTKVIKILFFNFLFGLFLSNAGR